MTAIVFPFRFHPLFRVPALLAGVRNDNARVEVVGDLLTARFGHWTVRTPLSNVVGAEVTGPYTWLKVLGPPHLSLRDRGLTFATNPEQGVCIRLAVPVRGIEPFGVLRHPALTVTVSDPAGLAELLDRAAHDEHRTHTPRDRPTVEDLVDEAVDELSALSAAELRRRAASRGIPRVSRMSRAELLTALSPGQPGPR